MDKKPKATFGDVMRGIRAGQGGEGEGRPKGDRPRRDRGPRRESAKAAEPKTEAAPPVEEKKAKGPVVMVRRAGGVVETTRGAEAPVTPSEAAAPAAPEAPAVETPRKAPEPSPARTPDHSLYSEVPEEQSFEEMFEAQARTEGALPSRKGVRVGEKVKAKIFQLGADTAFLSIGGKSEAMIELRELKDEEGILRLGVGDEVEAYVMETGAKGIILSRSLAKGTATLARLAEAKMTGLPVEGLVLSVNKGGLEVAVGDVRAFCPVSQIDLRFVEKPDQFVGEKLKFRVTEVRERNVVLSRRALLEEEQRAKAAETRKNLHVGAVLKGTVVGVRDFGAFVDLGGVEGLVPVSELSYVRVGHPSEVVKVGDEVEVEVLKIEGPDTASPDKSKQKERIGLSLRSLKEDPWKAAVEEFQEGSQVTGKVVRLQPFGAFVELKPGVDGLIHISALSNRRIAHPRDVVNVGQEVTVIVDKVDLAEKRIGLRLEGVEASAAAPSEAGAAEAGQAKAPEARARVGQVVTGTVDRIESYGVFVKFPGGTGLVPGNETGTERGTDLRRQFSMGQELKVLVKAIEGGKIKLSITGAAAAEERAELEAWKRTQPKASGKGFGTLGDLLKNMKE